PACAVVGEPHKKPWPALINCRLYSRSSDRNRVVRQQDSFRRHGESVGNRRVFPVHPSLGISHCYTRLAVRKAEKMVSVAALLGMLAVSSLISVVVPNAKTVEKDYHPIEVQSSPAK